MATIVGFGNLHDITPLEFTARIELSCTPKGMVNCNTIAA